MARLTPVTTSTVPMTPSPPNFSSKMNALRIAEIGALAVNSIPVRRGPNLENASNSAASPIARPTNPDIASGSQSVDSTVPQPPISTAMTMRATDT